MNTRILKVPPGPEPGAFTGAQPLDTWTVSTAPAAQPVLAPLRVAAALLRTSDIPVAFPTETVYGLGADATRSAAVRGIYAAKGRPADNPLIVHVCDLAMLRRLLQPTIASSTPTTTATTSSSSNNASSACEEPEDAADDDADPIPAIYRPLLARFWPGPLTVLLRLPAAPPPPALAPEVTAGLPTFGARLPASALARTLIALAGVPLAAPSANASTRPSPTAAAHVRADLGGRVALVLDGGACAVGVESTVVDGLCAPPAVLRPGGVGLAEIRRVRGWEGCVKGWRDEGEEEGVAGGGRAAPRAPGMKYKHYSPRARVVLFETGAGDVLAAVKGERGVVGIVRTLRWERLPGEEVSGGEAALQDGVSADGDADLGYEIFTSMTGGSKVVDIGLGRDLKSVAQGLFSALRELDRRGAGVIFVEGVEDRDGIAAAVMNRLRKAASEIRT